MSTEQVVVLKRHGLTCTIHLIAMQRTRVHGQDAASGLSDKWPSLLPSTIAAGLASDLARCGPSWPIGPVCTSPLLVLSSVTGPCDCADSPEGSSCDGAADVHTDSQSGFHKALGNFVTQSMPQQGSPWAVTRQQIVPCITSWMYEHMLPFMPRRRTSSGCNQRTTATHLQCNTHAGGWGAPARASCCGSGSRPAAIISALSRITSSLSASRSRSICLQAMLCTVTAS